MLRRTCASRPGSLRARNSTGSSSSSRLSSLWRSKTGRGTAPKLPWLRYVTSGSSMNSPRNTSALAAMRRLWLGRERKLHVELHLGDPDLDLDAEGARMLEALGAEDRQI